MESEWSRPLNRTNARFVVSLLLLTALAFLPVFGNGFVDYDDKDYLTGNPSVREGLSPAAVRWAFTTGHTGNWHPITWLSHLLDVSIFGLNPAAHHAVSLLLHAASAVILYFLVRGMTGWTFAAWLAAALFAVHPLHVESVAWAAERKDVLSGFFFMLTLLAWAQHLRSGRNTPSNFLSTTRWYVWSLLFFAIGLMSKPMLVTLPFVLLLLDWWPLGRLTAAGSAPVRVDRRRLGPLVLEKAPFLTLAAASSVVTFLVQQDTGAMRTTDFAPIGVRLGNAVTSVVAYLGKTVLPFDLSVAYPYPQVFPSPGRFSFAAAILLACSLMSFLAARRRPHLFTGWWWFAGMLIPVLGLVQVGFQSMADRYTYLPLIGVILALAVEGEHFVVGSLRGGRIMAGATVAVVLFLCVLTFRQAAVWRDAVSLFSHAVDVTDDNWVAQLNLGLALSRQERVEEARRHFEEVLRLRPEYLRAHQRLEIPAAGSGKGRPGDEARYRLAVQLMRTGRVDEAAELFRGMLRSGSMVSEANNNLGVIEAQAGRLENAETLFRRAVEAGPENAEARGNLSLLLSRQGRP